MRSIRGWTCRVQREVRTVLRIRQVIVDHRDDNGTMLRCRPRCVLPASNAGDGHRERASTCTIKESEWGRVGLANRGLSGRWGEHHRWLSWEGQSWGLDHRGGSWRVCAEAGVSDMDGSVAMNPEERSVDGEPRGVAERRWVPEREPNRYPRLECFGLLSAGWYPDQPLLILVDVDGELTSGACVGDESIAEGRR